MSATIANITSTAAIPDMVKALERCAVMLERVVRRQGFVVGCDAAAKEARAVLIKAGVTT